MKHRAHITSSRWDYDKEFGLQFFNLWSFSRSALSDTSVHTNMPGCKHPGCLLNFPGAVLLANLSLLHDTVSEREFQPLAFSSCLEMRHLVVMSSLFPLPCPLIRYLSRFPQIKIQRALNEHWWHTEQFPMIVWGSHIFRSAVMNSTGVCLKMPLDSSTLNKHLRLILSQGPHTYLALWWASLDQKFR